MWWKTNKGKLLILVLTAAVLAGVFYYGGNSPGSRGWGVAEKPPTVSEPGESGVNEERPETGGSAEPDVNAKPEVNSEPAEGSGSADLPEPPAEEQAEAGGAEPQPGSREPEDKGLGSQAPGSQAPGNQTPDYQNPGTEPGAEKPKDKYLTDPVPEGKPLPMEPQDAKIGTAAYTCTLSISCETILSNLELFNKEKLELLPEDGWILPPTSVTFYEGESVFNVLQRTCKQLKIHMEYENTPIYNSAYVEGIHNIYEFDAGDLSGWMYKVNDWFPNYGCSRYQVKDGDVIEWVYTCDLGYDVGGGYAVGS